MGKYFRFLKESYVFRGPVIPSHNNTAMEDRSGGGGNKL